MWFATKPVHKKLFLGDECRGRVGAVGLLAAALELLPGSRPDSFAAYVKTEG